MLASPGVVLETGVEMVRTGELTGHLAQSLRTLLTAAFVSVIIGVPLGSAIGLSPIFASGAELTLRFLRNVSAIALLPLFVVWFGLGLSAVNAVVLYVTLVVVVYNSLGAIRSVPRKYIAVVRTLGGRWRHQLLGVFLPASLPGIMTGIRLCISYGWRAVVGAELILSAPGIGGLLSEGRAAGRVDLILLGMVVVGVTNVVLEFMVLIPLDRAVGRRWGIS